MLIDFFQMDVVHGAPGANLEKLEVRLKAEGAGELFVLPELFNTGYLFEERAQLFDLAEEIPGGPVCRRLAELATEYQTTFVAGLAERDGELLFNSVAVIGPGGFIGKYRKLALTNLDKWYFDRGAGTPVFEVGGLRLGVAICFDVWFPEIVQAYSRQNVDLLIHPAAFGAPWSCDLARARALENNLAVLTCNRVGAESARGVDGHFRGDSRLIDGLGNVVKGLGGDEEFGRVEFLAPGGERKVLGVGLEEERGAVRGVLGDYTTFR